MVCKRCGTENGEAKKTCVNCGAILEGYTMNNVTGEYGYRGVDGKFRNNKDSRIMKATELQLGDYLSYNGQIIKVESITKKKVGYHIKPNECHMHYARLRDLEPIPLEKVHLIKNGFKAREETDDTEFYYYDCYEINVSFDEGISEENIPPIIFLTIEFAEKSIAMPIEYIHELQQAMRVMGCDKEIEL